MSEQKSELYCEKCRTIWCSCVQPRELTLNAYQRSMHTYAPKHQECHALGVCGELAEVVETLARAVAGNDDADERAIDAFKSAGRIADMVKKQQSHGVALDRAALVKELGDVLWYVAAVASDNAITLEEVAQTNIAKLRARYPDGWQKGGSVREVCVEAPTNWRCTRDGGHDGPCAALPDKAPPPPPTVAVAFACGCLRFTDGSAMRVATCNNKHHLAWERR